MLLDYENLTPEEKKELASDRLKYLKTLFDKDQYKPKIPVYDFIKYSKSLTPKQVKWINDEFKRFEDYKTVTKYFEESGEKKELIDLMESLKEDLPTKDIGEKCKKGHFVGRISALKQTPAIDGSYFSIIKVKIKQIGKEEKYSSRLEKLSNEFFEIYNSLKGNQ